MNDGNAEKNISPITVFVSYSQDSEQHSEQVKSFCDRLIRGGVDCILDSYVEGSPAKGWVKWMVESVQKADFIIVVCTENYFKKYSGLEKPSVGQGVICETTLILENIYYNDTNLKKITPVIFDQDDKQFIPPLIKSATYYCLSDDNGFESIYRFLTDQPKIKKPKLGDLIDYNSADTGQVKGVAEAQVVLSFDYDSFSDKDKEFFAQSLKNMLNMDQDIVIKKIRRGSVIIDIELPIDGAIRLKELYESGSLESLNVVSVNFKRVDEEIGLSLVRNNVRDVGKEKALNTVDKEYIRGVASFGARAAAIRHKAVYPLDSSNGFYDMKEKSEIPDMSGISGKVLSILSRSVHDSALNINVVAEELNFSKRTLQRYLGHENSNFSNLKDRVRFHYSVKCLMEDNLTIDETANLLGFETRTSFAMAFKRWADMSPSVFRKLYRDYF